ncbi:MAG TPA: methylated-DNA--[protein]-cysteine S-methyltransferase [Thermoanaerobaculia bacterium]|jgi:methylated-DNA-[protein]-cysteine S-methyltransferase
MTTTLYADLLPTPLPTGRSLLAQVDERGALVGLHFVAPGEDRAALDGFGRQAAARGQRLVREPGRCPTLAIVAAQLAEYFAGRRRDFDLELDPPGTPFQRQVWGELARIPYGATVSYGELARRVGRPNASRAVGAANGANPIPIVLPCHRVIGSDGSLTGYGGGLPIKRALLSLEGALPDDEPRLAFD